MNVVRSPRILLFSISVGLCLNTLSGGCSTSRWTSKRNVAQSSAPAADSVAEDTTSRIELEERSEEEQETPTLASNTDRISSVDVDREQNAATDNDESRRSSNVPSRPVKQTSVLEESNLASVIDASFAANQLPAGNGQSIASRRLQIPKELPGAEAPTVDLPPHEADDAEERARDIAKHFVPLPTVPAARVSTADTGRVYTLDELQSIALAGNPIMLQADAQIMATTGSAVQAGLHPNPIIGYEADTVNSNANPNYQGGYLDTIIKTAGKLKLARSVATVDIWNAELARQRARIDLITQVRGAYFATLIARENVKVTEALVRFTDSVYQIQLDQLRGGLVSVYEPIQLRALAMQARTTLTQARNRYDAAWRQLASTVGNPEMPIGELAGFPDVAIPAVDYDSALPYVMANHTDVLSARNSQVQARVNLRLQEVTPIPDLVFYTALQKDYTTAPIYRMTYNMQVGVPVPIFDKNQGNIMKAHATLIKSSQEASRVQNELATRLADAIERYSNTTNIATMYRDNVLPDQARAYRGVYERHQQQPDLVGFADVVNAQQTLLASIGIYINSLAARWQAFTDIGSLLQIETIEGIEALLSGRDPMVLEDAVPIIPPSPSEEP